MKPVAKWGGIIFASAAAVGTIAYWEGGKRADGTSVVYADRLAGGLPTVCSGLTRHITKTPIVVGETWSKAKCDEEERKAVTIVQRQLVGCWIGSPPQSVFDAATSFAWNVGAPAVCRSGAMRAWNAGDYALGCRRMAYTDTGRRAWSYAGGKFVQGLANRREHEMRLCMKDVR